MSWQVAAFCISLAALLHAGARVWEAWQRARLNTKRVHVLEEYEAVLAAARGAIHRSGDAPAPKPTTTLGTSGIAMLGLHDKPETILPLARLVPKRASKPKSRPRKKP